MKNIAFIVVAFVFLSNSASAKQTSNCAPVFKSPQQMVASIHKSVYLKHETTFRKSDQQTEVFFEYPTVEQSMRLYDLARHWDLRDNFSGMLNLELSEVRKYVGVTSLEMALEIMGELPRDKMLRKKALRTIHVILKTVYAIPAGQKEGPIVSTSWTPNNARPLSVYDGVKAYHWVTATNSSAFHLRRQFREAFAKQELQGKNLLPSQVLEILMRQP